MAKGSATPALTGARRDAFDALVSLKIPKDEALNLINRAQGSETGEIVTNAMRLRGGKSQLPPGGGPQPHGAVPVAPIMQAPSAAAPRPPAPMMPAPPPQAQPQIPGYGPPGGAQAAPSAEQLGRAQFFQQYFGGPEPALPRFLRPISQFFRPQAQAQPSAAGRPPAPVAQRPPLAPGAAPAQMIQPAPPAEAAMPIPAPVKLRMRVKAVGTKIPEESTPTEAEEAKQKAAGIEETRPEKPKTEELPLVASQEEYNKLPLGTRFKHPDGFIYRKESESSAQEPPQKLQEGGVVKPKAEEGSKLQIAPISQIAPIPQIPLGMTEPAQQMPSTDTDTVPAELTPGEYVVPKPAVDAIGAGNLAALSATALGQRPAVTTAATTTPATTRGLGTLPGGTKSGYNAGRWDPVLDQIATKLGVDPLLLKSIARQENVAAGDFNPLGISPHGGGPTHYAGVEEGTAGMEAYVRAHLPHFQAVKPNDRVSVFNFAKWYSPPDAPNDPNQSNPSEGPGIFGQYHRLLEHGPVARMQEGGLVSDTDEFQGGGGAGSVGTTGGWGPEVSPEAIGAAQQTAQQYQTPMPAPVAQPVVSPAAVAAAQQTAQQYGGIPRAQLAAAGTPNWSTLQAEQNWVTQGIGPAAETRQDIAHKNGYATVAYNNPGGMWPGPSSRKFGATTYGILNDPDRNHIASFETPLHGAAAQFDLLADPNAPYVNKPLINVIRKWSKSKTDKTGSEQNVQDYVKSLGLPANTIVTPELLRSPTGIALAKKQAAWEGNGNFKMSDDDWQKAQAMAYGSQ